MARGMDKPKQLEIRQKSYDANNKSASGQEMKRPGSRKK